MSGIRDDDQPEQFTAEWHPGWIGGHVKLYNEEGVFIKHLPISQIEGERLASANDALGTRWVVENSMSVDEEDVIVHAGKPPWRRHLPESQG